MKNKKSRIKINNRNNSYSTSSYNNCPINIGRNFNYDVKWKQWNIK